MDIMHKIEDFVLDCIDYIRYDILKQKFKEVEFSPPQKLSFRYRTEEDGGIYCICNELQGLIISAAIATDLPEVIVDALLLYYDIPRYQAKRIAPELSRWTEVTVNFKKQHLKVKFR